MGSGRPGAAKRLTVGAAVVAVLIGCAGAGWWYTHREDMADPETVEIPAPRNPDATAAFMRKDGAVLVKFLDVTDDLSATADQQDCADLVSTELTKLGSPPRLAALAQDVPDPTLRDALQNHVRTVSVYLGACGTGEGLEDAAEQAHFTAVVARRQLDEVQSS